MQCDLPRGCGKYALSPAVCRDLVFVVRYILSHKPHEEAGLKRATQNLIGAEVEDDLARLSLYDVKYQLQFTRQARESFPSNEISGLK